MNQPLLKIAFVIKLTVACFMLIGQTFAQGYGLPLTMQAIDHFSLHSTASRSAGGITVGLDNDVSIMFTNPALMQNIGGLQLSVGGFYQTQDVEHTQKWYPLRYLPNFSLLMESLTDGLPDPSKPDTVYDRSAYIQRPYDSIKPNWSNSKKNRYPIQALLAVPFSIEGIKIVAGVGAVEYANLNHNFQNNNVLSPSLGSQRPYAIHLPYPKDTIHVDWMQYQQKRSGSIYGYGGAISLSLSEKITFGFSGMLISGSTDDEQSFLGRGRLRFFQVNNTYFFIADSVDYNGSDKGTSDYKGQEFNISGLYRSNYINLSFSVKPPTEITRKYSGKIVSKNKAGILTSNVSGKEDKIKIPWRSTFGVSLNVRSNFVLGFEYDWRPYASAIYTDTNNVESKPWLSSSLYKVGAEYRPIEWLAIRAGMRQQSEVFEPEGNPLIGEAVKYSIYSVGCGFKFSGIRLNFGYEFYEMKYQDMWATNVNTNTIVVKNFSADISYEIPW